MKDINKEYVRAYIQDHNITRPIWLTQAAFIYMPIIILIGLIVIILTNHMHGIIENIVLTILIVFTAGGIYLRKRNKELHIQSKGKALYNAEIILNAILVVGGIYSAYIIYALGYAEDFWFTCKVSALLGVAAFLYAVILQNIRISKGYYLEKEKKEKKVFNDVKYIPLYIVLSSFLKRIRNESVLIAMFSAGCLIIVTCCIYYATTYCLKLRYAKKYDMEDCLPTEPL